MIRPGLACLVLAGCGGPAQLAAPAPAPRTCEARWLTVEDEVVDLAPSVDGLLWLGRERGLALAPWSGAPRGLDPAGPDEVDPRAVVSTPRGVVWAAGDGAVWRVAAGAAPTVLATVGEPVALAAVGDLIVVGAVDGVHRIYPNGDHRRLFDGEVAALTVDERAAYVAAGDRLVRVPLDGAATETLARRTPAVRSMVRHDGQLLVATDAGVFAVAGGRLVPYAPVDLPVPLGNLQSVAGRVYLTAGNLILMVRDGVAEPIAIASGDLVDLAVDGPTLYVATREHPGVAAVCHDPIGAPVAIEVPTLACGPDEVEAEGDARALACVGGDGALTYAVAHHASGARAWEHGRDGRRRSWDADGTLRSEEPAPGRPGPVVRYFPDGCAARAGRGRRRRRAGRGVDPLRPRRLAARGHDLGPRPAAVRAGPRSAIVGAMTTPATWTTAITAGWSITTVDGPGPTLLWLHGLGEHAATFAPAIAHLPQHRHLLLDLPGHGGARAALARGAAPWTQPPSIAETAGHLAELLSAIRPAAVIGHSLGGVIALALAEREPVQPARGDRRRRQRVAGRLHVLESDRGVRGGGLRERRPRRGVRPPGGARRSDRPRLRRAHAHRVGGPALAVLRRSGRGRHRRGPRARAGHGADAAGVCRRASRRRVRALARAAGGGWRRRPRGRAGGPLAVRGAPRAVR
jgi:pimeloyl-ACP methyl ester carboxylesterase